MEKMDIVNIAFYHFFEFPGGPESHRQRLKTKCLELGLRGTVLMAPEGMNVMLSGTRVAIDEMKFYLKQFIGTEDLQFKESLSDYQPFRRLFIKVKEQLIPVNDAEINPKEETAPAISPSELKVWMDEKKDFVLIDTRNHFEIEFGTFQNAVDPELHSFRAFEDKLKTFPQEWKDKEVVAFCTGGIRCEKATPLMMKYGYKHVRQLQGGILNYFKEIGGEHYKGGCFVFDERMVLDPALQEIKDVVCESCGHTVTKHEQKISSYENRVSCPHCMAEGKG